MGTTKRGVRRVGVPWVPWGPWPSPLGQRARIIRSSFTPKSPEEPEKGAALKESGAFAQVSSRGGNGRVPPY